MSTPTIYETGELAAIRAQISRFVQEEVVPNGEEWEKQGRVPRRLFKALGKMGLFGLRVPESQGGAGLGHLASATVAEEFGKSTFGGVMASVAVHGELAMPYIYRFGSPFLQEKYLPPMLAGDLIGALGVTEAGAGSDVAALPRWRGAPASPVGRVSATTRPLRVLARPTQPVSRPLRVPTF